MVRSLYETQHRLGRYFPGSYGSACGFAFASPDRSHAALYLIDAVVAWKTLSCSDGLRLADEWPPAIESLDLGGIFLQLPASSSHHREETESTGPRFRPQKRLRLGFFFFVARRCSLLQELSRQLHFGSPMSASSAWRPAVYCRASKRLKLAVEHVKIFRMTSTARQERSTHTSGHRVVGHRCQDCCAAVPAF